MRSFQFQTGEYYHIYNRGVDKRDVFMDDEDYLRFLRSMREFNNIEAEGGLYMKYLRETKERGGDLISSLEIKSQNRLVEFISYCLNPNHFHFLIKQVVENGITKFIQKISIGYTMYFNQKYSRSGSLFQGTYKAIHVDDDGYLLKLLVYINCNYEIHNLGKAEKWPWSSCLDSIGVRKGTLCNLGIVNEEFGNGIEFKNFCREILPEIKENKTLSKFLLE